MKEECQTLNWEIFLNEGNVNIDDMWKRFHKKLTELEDTYVPILKIRNKKKTEIPLDKETLKAVKEKKQVIQKNHKNKKTSRMQVHGKK